MHMEYSFSSKELLQYLLERKCGSILLDGYSGCGKTSLLKQLKAKSIRPVYLFSYRDIVDEMVRTNCTCSSFLRDINPENCIIGIEDVDYLCGREYTQRILSDIVQLAAKKHLVILTGNDIQRKAEILWESSLHVVIPLEASIQS